MSDNHRRYRNIKQAFRQLLPTAGKGLDILSALVSGIVGSKSTHYSQIASKVPGATKLESRVKSYSRWVNKVSAGLQVHCMPFAQELLTRLASGQTLYLVMDGSEVGRKCVALMLSVVYRRRALPLAWIVVQGKKGHFPEAMHRLLVQTVHAWVPQITDVVLLGDGEFDGIGLQADLETYFWRYVCRTAKNTLLYKAGAECAYCDLPLRAGMRWSIANVLMTQRRYGPVRAIGWWRRDCQTPLYLVTNLDSPEEACQAYQKRFRIETFFSDQKSRGFHLDKSHIANAARLAHLMLAAALAYLWIVYLGALALETGLYRIIHRTERCDLSLFQLGFKMLDYLMDHDLPIPVSFILSEDVI